MSLREQLIKAGRITPAAPRTSVSLWGQGFPIASQALFEYEQYRESLSLNDNDRS